MGFKEQMAVWNQKINNFFKFIGNKLKNFQNITLGEQISYSSIGVGLILIITSTVMFVV